MKQWYEELFENYALQYDREEFTQGTQGEVDFIEKEIGHDKEADILDIGCGTGRHAIELARRGYRVTGMDLSPSQLNRARRKARALGLKIRFHQRDARYFSTAKRYDLALLICEGAFPLMETDEMNYQILLHTSSCLKKKGKLILTTLNGLFPLFHSVKDFINSNDPQCRSSENTFDLMTFRDHSVVEVTDDRGKKKTLRCNERYYVPSEMTWLLRSAGFEKVSISGCRLGAFSRDDKLTPDDFEMLVVAEK
jgi:2-polyprenyl-3-methyl-5-hydroxy-6-metoxy-1,4-benzoquinol methylase